MTNAALKAILKDSSKGLVLKPVLHTYLYDAKFPDFSVHFINHEMTREPDGYFHPSTHPLWTERQLFWYLVRPEMMQEELKDHMGTLAVTMGTAAHGFVQNCLGPNGAGVLLDAEVYVEDQESGSRGSMDGVLKLPHRDEDVFEFKTSNPMKLAKIEDHDLESYREKWPVYYAQNQEYMRMSGYRNTIVLFMTMSYPFVMKEFIVPYDPPFALGIRDKYLRVRQAVADQQQPMPCCNVKSAQARSCIARAVCDVGRMS
jgi:hypothetical protein